MARYVTVVPAYGRDYRNANEVREAWNANKDFVLASPFDRAEFGGSYVNQVDLARWNSDPTHEKVVVHVRYRKAEFICEIVK